MKTASDPRHKLRRKILRELFANEFTTQEASTITKKILANTRKIDKLIQSGASQWPIEKINKIDLAILRLAIWELKTKKDTSYKIIIDEAIELAKEFGAQSTPAFVNAVLGKIVKDEKLN
jgi:N utilization substance protein B